MPPIGVTTHGDLIQSAIKQLLRLVLKPRGVTTGISAADRSRTVQTAVAANAKPSDLVQPGHIFPVQARPGGVLMRAGHTEAGCDLARLAGLEPAAVIVRS